MFLIRAVCVLGAASFVGALRVPPEPAIGARAGPPELEPTAQLPSDRGLIQLGVQSASLEAAHPEGPGRILHFSVRQDGSAEVFGFELRSVAGQRGEIVSASDWRQMPASELVGDMQSETLEEVRRSNSQQEPSRERVGVLVPATSVDHVAEGLLDRFPVGIFFASWVLSFWAKPVLANGPLATFEFPQPLAGEQRLLSSALSLMAMEGKTLITMTPWETTKETQAALHDVAQRLQKAVIKHHTVLQFAWGMFGTQIAEHLAGFPSACIIEGTDYWGAQSHIIHATPDDLRARAAGEVSESVPVMISRCHAEDSAMKRPAAGYVLLYGPEPASSVVQAVASATGLPVRYIDKRVECDGAGSSAPFGCIPKATSLSQFHNILRDARMIVGLQDTHTDVPTLLEATACGTPVLVFHGRHKMLERFADGTHVMVWESIDDLHAAARRALDATSRGNHKLPEWQPPPLAIHTMRERLGLLIETTMQNCGGNRTHLR